MKGFYTWDAALDFLYRFCNFEVMSLRAAPGEYRLDRVARILKAAGDPQLEIPAIHVAGTKGKGSTVFFLEHLFRAAGLKTGSFTSPHIVSERERFKLDGQAILEKDFIDAVNKAAALLDKMFGDYRGDSPTTFEIFVLMAFSLFKDRQINMAVIETGLGGRLDATNLLLPRVSVITSVSYDHTAILGKDLAGIAAEKAGIIKDKTPVVLGRNCPQVQAVVKAKAAEMNAPLYMYGHDFFADRVRTERSQTDFHYVDRLMNVRIPVGIRMIGDFQAENAACAIKAFSLERGRPVNTAEIASIKTPRLAGRMEFDKNIVFDGAHNADSLKRLFQNLKYISGQNRFTVLFALRNDKETDRIVPVLEKWAAPLYLTRAGSAKDLPPEELAEKLNVSSVIVEGLDCFLRTEAHRLPLLVVTGSFYLISRVKGILGPL